MRKLMGLFLAACVSMAFAQTAPVVESMPDDTLTVGTGANFLIVPGIDDGDAGATQTLAVTAQSDNNTIVEVDSVSYTSGDRTAILHVTEKDQLGTVTVTVSVTDADGTTDGTMNVTVAPINNPGIQFEVHDVIFWQQEVPVDKVPVYSEVLLDEARIEDGELNWDLIPITVNLDCTGGPCRGHDFPTQFYRGYLMVPTTGSYTFFMEGNNEKSLWLSPDDDPANAVAIVHSPDGIGTDVGSNQWQSAPQTLTAGVVYAIYATHWVVHWHNSGILWQGPGVSKQYIPAQYLMPTYSLEKPDSPDNLAIVTRGTDFIRVSWDAPAGATPTAYHVYVDGVLSTSLTTSAVTIDGLSQSQAYSIFVVAEDALGKISFPTNVVTASTYGPDGTPPTAPTSVTADTVSDLALYVAWSGATDGESEVSYYNIYVDNVQFNTEPCYDDFAVIPNLTPETSYDIQVEAVDGGGNASPRSSTLTVSTLAFDPANPLLGVMKAAVTFTETAVADASGFGINSNYHNGDFLTANIDGLLDDLQPSLMRWGALTANPLNFGDHIGTSPSVTFGDFLNDCNERGAYCSITTGVANGTDWMNNSQTFANFIEYLNGPSTTTYGAYRAAEGYTQPLMENCPGLLIELGNEVWGGSAHNAQIGDDYPDSYGDWARAVSRIMKASPYFDHDKMKIVYSGRSPHPADCMGVNFLMAQGDTGEVDAVAPSGYLGGNLNYDPEIPAGESEGDYYKEGWKRVQRNLDGLEITTDWYRNNLGLHKFNYLYESNMTTTTYNGRLGQAVTMIEYGAGAVERASVAPSLFHLTGGQWKMVRTTEGNFELPLFVAAKFYNRNCRGVALGGSISTQGGLVDSRGIGFASDPVGYHLYNNGDNFTALLVSKDFEEDYTVQLNLPASINASSSATMIVLSGSDFSTIETTVDSSSITLTNGMLVTVPKHSVVFIKFTGSGLGVDLPLGYYPEAVGTRNPATKIGPQLNLRNSAPCEIYNLLGKRITVANEANLRTLNLPSGMYITRQDKEVRKLHESLLKK